MAQAIDRELEHYIMMLNLSQKKSILSVIKTFLQPSEAEERISREQYNLEIKEAERRMDAGKFISQTEVDKQILSW